MSATTLRDSLRAVLRAISAHPGWATAIFAFLVSLEAFGPSLRGGFAGDDFAYVSRFAALPFSEWPTLFVREWSGGVWGYALPELRPITGLTLMLDARVWGVDAFGFRLTNLLLHAVCAGFVGWLTWRVAGRCVQCAALAALLFAVHPVHVEPVAWSIGRVDIVPTLAYLAGFVAFVRYRDTGAGHWLPALWLAYGAAVFSKEFGLTLPLMALVADAVWLGRGRSWRSFRTWLPYVGWIAVVGLYFWCRRLALGDMATQAPFSGDTTRTAWAVFCDRQLSYLGHLFPPTRDLWLRDDLPAIARHGTWLLPVVAVGVGLLVAAWARFAPSREKVERRGAVFFALGWYLIATLPLVVTYVSARHLYLASAGLCIAVAVGLRGLWARPWFVGGVGAILAAWLAMQLAAPLRGWAKAAEISAQAGREASALVARVPQGSLVLLDTPSMWGVGYSWAWAAPFSLRPPFAPEDLTAKCDFLTLPDVWYYPGRWAEQPALHRLRTQPGEVWLLRVDGEGPPVARKLDPLVVQAVAVRELPPGAKENSDWRRFLRALEAP